MDITVYAVLDWGLGHASRSIPLIDKLIDKGENVVIASSGIALKFLELEYPSLKKIILPSYNIEYKGSVSLSILKTLPGLIKVIKRENEIINDFVESNSVKKIISDNRYGCYNKEIESVIIIHQLNIQLPLYFNLFKPLINIIHNKYLKKFDEIWIPDYHDRRLSGKLSETSNKNIKFIGALSRLEVPENEIKKDISILAILSGPEPKRQELEDILIDKLNGVENSVIVSGTDKKSVRIGKLEVMGMLNSEEINNLINKSDKLILRSGYSTIMDLYKLGRGALVIPTPGQTEQEYLAKFHNGKNEIIAIQQNEFSLNKKLLIFDEEL